MANRARRAGRGPDYDWFLSTFSGAFASGGSAINAGLTFTTKQTIMRNRGQYVVSIDGPTDGDKINVGLGLIIVSSEALAAGVTSIPLPISNGDAPWLWHQLVPLMAQAGTGVGASLNAMSVVGRGEIDAKAMRKVGLNEALVFVMQSVSTSGTPAVDIVGAFRTLVAS